MPWLHLQHVGHQLPGRIVLLLPHPEFESRGTFLADIESTSTLYSEADDQVVFRWSGRNVKGRA